MSVGLNSRSVTLADYRSVTRGVSMSFTSTWFFFLLPVYVFFFVTFPNGRFLFVFCQGQGKLSWKRNKTYFVNLPTISVLALAQGWNDRTLNIVRTALTYLYLVITPFACSKWIGRSENILLPGYFTASVAVMRFNEKELVSLSRQPSEKAAELGMRGPKKGDGNTALSHRLQHLFSSVIFGFLFFFVFVFLLFLFVCLLLF